MNAGGSIGGGKLEGEETASLNYDELSQFSQNTYDNSSLNSKQDLYIHNEVKEEDESTENVGQINCEEEEVLDPQVHSTCSKVEYDSIDSSSSSSSSSTSHSSSNSNNSSIYLSYGESESSSLSSSSSLASSLMTSLSIGSSRHSCCSFTSYSSNSSSNSYSSSNFSDYDENEHPFEKKIRKKSINSLKDNDEAALKLLEHRYLKHNKEKLKDKKKRKLFFKFSKKRASLNSLKSQFSLKSEQQQEKSSLNQEEINDEHEIVS